MTSAAPKGGSRGIGGTPQDVQSRLGRRTGYQDSSGRRLLAIVPRWHQGNGVRHRIRLDVRAIGRSSSEPDLPCVGSPNCAGNGERRLEVIPGLVESSKAVVNDSEVAEHDALQVGVAHVPGHGQRRLEVVEGLTQTCAAPEFSSPRLHSVFPSIRLCQLACYGKRGFTHSHGFVDVPISTYVIAKIDE